MDSNKITFYNAVLMTLNILIMLSVVIWFKGTPLAWPLIFIQFTMCGIQAILCIILVTQFNNKWKLDETTKTDNEKEY